MRHRRRGLRLPIPSTPCVRLVVGDDGMVRSAIDGYFNWPEMRRRFIAAMAEPERDDSGSTAILVAVTPDR